MFTNNYNAANNLKSAKKGFEKFPPRSNENKLSFNKIRLRFKSERVYLFVV